MPYADKEVKKAYDARRNQTPEYKAAQRARTSAPAYRERKKVYDVVHREENFPRLEAQRASWRARNAAKMERYRRDWGLRRDYGITLDDYERMVAAQKGLCAICSSPPPAKRPVLLVDHNHATGAVRGLLCVNCNFAVGHLYDSVERALRLIAYLERWK